MRSGKQLLTVLLLLACILSGIILAATPPYQSTRIKSAAELDSLIYLSFGDANFLNNQIRTYNIPIDTVFSRKVYRIQVPPSFSKTGFHVNLHHRMTPFGFDTPSRVVFPDRDMNIFLTYEGTVVRTIRLLTSDIAIPEESNSN